MVSLLPQPSRMLVASGTFELDATSTLHAAVPFSAAARQLRALLGPATGFDFPSAGADATIVIVPDTELADEAYRLDVTCSGIRLRAGSERGALHGVTTLVQLLPAQVYRKAKVEGVRWELPLVSIEDEPRFSWRGLMLDVARHFLPKAGVLRMIDLAALHRLNVVHLHLTDDQGWRFEVKKYPRLTEVGAWRAESQVGVVGEHPTSNGRPHGGYYTQEDLREIVSYGKERGITVVPEIDLPGHMVAAIASYPNLGVQPEHQIGVRTQWGISSDVLNAEDATAEFLTDIFDELLEVFDSPVIGIGGDECPKDQWKTDPRTQELMQHRGITTEDGLQAWFVERLSRHLEAHGRRPFGWDELLADDLPATTIIASWRGMAGASEAARRGLDVVSCPNDQVYLDCRSSDDPREPIPFANTIDVARCLAFDPVPTDLAEAERVYVIGGQANLWTEHIDDPRTLDYMAFPRLCAVAEALWNGPGDYAEFSPRLEEHLARLDAFAVEYRRSSGPLPWQERPDAKRR